MPTSEELRRAQWREGQRRRRLRKRGELEPWQPLGADIFAHGVVVTSADGDWCLQWPRAANSNGYGRVWIDGKLQLASRASLALKLGRPIKDGMWALHTCDNPPCYRSEHLFEGTPKENTDDMTDKQRAYWQAIKRTRQDADEGPGETSPGVGEVSVAPPPAPAESGAWLLDLRGAIQFRVSAR